MRPSAIHYILAVLAVIFIAGVLPRVLTLLGGPQLPGSGPWSTPMPIFILSVVVNGVLVWELVRTLRGKARVELAQREKQHEALHDPLTGAANRRSFELSLKEATGLRRPRHALLMIDLDNFKPVNDIYGHAAGDQILCEITAGIRKLSRPDDIVCRLGGDEFAVLLPEVDLKTAENIACKLLDFVRDYRMIRKGHRVQIGTSIGMVLIDRPGLDQTSILEASDVALYAAKEAGRGAVMIMEIPADFKTNRNYSPASARRVDAGAPAVSSSANSHKPTDGRQQILKGIPTVAYIENTDERRAISRRGSAGPVHWITVEPATVGDDFSPGMSMSELVADAALRADGGADLSRWTFGMTLVAASRLPADKLAKVGFVIPIPAKSVVAVPSLANELASALMQSSNPIRHLTIVMQNAEKVYDSPAIAAFISVMHLSKIKVGFQVRGTSFEQVSPLIHSPFDEIHMAREIHRSIKPGTSAHTAINALKTISANSNVTLVATEVDNVASLQNLGELGIQRISGPIIGKVEVLDAALKSLVN